MTRLITIAAILIVGWTVWPYYALYDLMAGLREGDQIRLENRVAWDRVRQGLRDDLNAFFIQKFGNKPGEKKNDNGNALGSGLAAVLGPSIINQVIETYVTPVGIVSLIKIGKTSALGQPPAGAAHAATAEVATEQRAINWDAVSWAFFSGGPATFRADIKTDPQARRPVTLIFRWDGDWRLTRIFLPTEN